MVYGLFRQYESVLFAGDPLRYGPTFTGFGKPWETAERDAIALLEGTKATFSGYPRFQSPAADEAAAADDPLAPYILDSIKELKSFVPSGGRLREADREQELTGSGILLGGCLDVLANLCGTHLDAMAAFNREYETVVWVLESCDGTPMEIRRQLWHLEHAGWFDRASLFVIGRPLASWRQTMMGLDQYRAVTDVLAGHQVPVIMDADVGHIAPAVPLAIGAQVTVSARGNGLTFAYPELAQCGG